MRRFRSLVLVASVAAATPGRGAAQGVVVTDSVRSPGLATNVLGDSAVRPVLIYLPPSYRHDRARRYPVLYMLHGATSVPEEWLDGTYQGLDLRVTLDSLVGAGAIPEMLVVMPNADNALGSHWYANSPALGNWEDFVVRDLVGYVDGHYRTDGRRARRALFGHSMGGFGALALGFRHPGLFGLVYASSPAMIGLVGPIAPNGPAWSALSGISRWQDAPTRLRLVVGLAAALDGSRSDPRLFAELPFSAGADGAMTGDPKVVARWRAGMPADLASAMVRHGGRPPVLLLEAGTEEADIVEGIALLRARLDSLRIRVADSTFTGGHVDRVRERLTGHMLPAVGRWIAQPAGTR